MDSITHGLSIITLLLAMGAMKFLPFGVLGAIILDIDVIFTPISTTYPSLFILSHGGVTHSVVGAVITSILAFLGMRYVIQSFSFQDHFLVRIPVLRDQVPLHCNFQAFLVLGGGALLHLGLDALASPGIPLLYPYSVKKYTLGLFPGPSILLMITSICFLVFLFYGKVSLADLRIYAVLLLIILLVHGGLRVYVETNNDGIAIPMLNPLSWLIIKENASSFTVDEYDTFRGVTTTHTFDRYRNITALESKRWETLPEVQGLHYYSYIITVEKNGTQIIYHDPLRERRLIWYPPNYTNVTVSS